MIDFTQDIPSKLSGWWLLNFVKDGETDPESSAIVPANSLFAAAVLSNQMGVNPGQGYDTSGWELESIEKVPPDMLQRSLNPNEIIDLEELLADD